MILVGIIASTATGILLARRRAFPMLPYITLIMFSLVVGMIGAKLYNFLLHLVSRRATSAAGGEGFFSQVQSAWKYSGESFIGMIIAFGLFGLWYIHRIGLPRWATADVVVVGFPLGQAVVRVGCFLNGCCYGRPTDSFLGVVFPGRSGPVHPAQLYELVGDLAIFGILLAVVFRKKFDGQICGLYLMLYAVVRFVVEYFRGDAGRGFLITGPTPWLSLSLPQAWAFVGFLSGIGIYLHRRRAAVLWPKAADLKS